MSVHPEHVEHDRRKGSTTSRRNYFLPDRRKSAIRNYMQYSAERFEELAIERIADKAVEAGLNFRQHAIKADLSSAPDVTWRAIRNRKQKLTMQYLVKLLNALEIEPASLMFEVQEMMKKESKQKKAANDH